MTYSIPSLVDGKLVTGLSNLWKANFPDHGVTDLRDHNQRIDAELAKFNIKWTVQPWSKDMLPEDKGMLHYEDPDELVRFQLTWG